MLPGGAVCVFVCTWVQGLHVTVCLCIFREKEGGLGAPFLVQGSKNPASFAVREECDL